METMTIQADNKPVTSVACPACGAEAGKPCHFPDGRETFLEHMARWRFFDEARKADALLRWARPGQPGGGAL